MFENMKISPFVMCTITKVQLVSKVLFAVPFTFPYIPALRKVGRTMETESVTPYRSKQAGGGRVATEGALATGGTCVRQRKDTMTRIPDEMYKWLTIRNILNDSRGLDEWLATCARRPTSGLKPDVWRPVWSPTSDVRSEARRLTTGLKPDARALFPIGQPVREPRDIGFTAFLYYRLMQGASHVMSRRKSPFRWNFYPEPVETYLLMTDIHMRDCDSFVIPYCAT